MESGYPFCPPWELGDAGVPRGPATYIRYIHMEFTVVGVAKTMYNGILNQSVGAGQIDESYYLPRNTNMNRSGERKVRKVHNVFLNLGSSQAN